MKKRIALIAIVVVAFLLTGCFPQSTLKFNIDFIVEGEVYDTIRTDSSTIEMPADPLKNGYVFDGWFWDDGIWEKPFTLNSIMDAPLSRILKIYAKFVGINDSTNISALYSGNVLEKELLLNAAFVSDGYLLSTRDGVEKYSLTGELLWRKEYSFIPKDKNAVSRLSHLNIIPCADDSFVIGFSFERYWTNDGSVYYNPVLAKCGKNGDLLWYKEYKSFDSSAFRKLFIRDDGKILTIGATKQPGTDRPADIYVSLLDTDGSVINERYYGGPAMMDMFRDAAYVEGKGLAALIDAQSGGSYFSSSNGGHLLVLFDDINLNIKWSITAPLFFRMAVTSEAIYLINSSVVTTDSILRKIDFSGKVIFDEIIDNRKEIATNFVGNSQYGLLIQKGKELVFYRDKTALMTIDFDAGDAKKIIENDDGFVIVSVKITGILPSPPSISSIWYSTDIIYGGYNSAGKLLWQFAHDNTPPELYELSKQFQN